MVVLAKAPQLAPPLCHGPQRTVMAPKGPPLRSTAGIPRACRREAPVAGKERLSPSPDLLELGTQSHTDDSSLARPGPSSQVSAPPPVSKMRAWWAPIKTLQRGEPPVLLGGALATQGRQGWSGVPEAPLGQEGVPGRGRQGFGRGLGGRTEQRRQGATAWSDARRPSCPLGSSQHCPS